MSQASRGASPGGLPALLAIAVLACAGQEEKPVGDPPAPRERPSVAARPSIRPRHVAVASDLARIAIVGDSISHSGETRDRLGRTLRRLLAVERPGIAVDTHAVPGQTCGRMIERFDEEVLAGYPPYDTVVIQCGTNDLYNDLGLKRIADDMDTMIALARGAGLRVVLITVPPAGNDDGWDAAMEQKRVGLNRWILGRADVIAVDASAVLGAGDPPALRPEYRFRDWIHPNDAGLDAVAAAVASALGDVR